MATPRAEGGTPRMLRPPIRTSPSVAGSRPQISRSSVDFPHPEGPTNTTNSPCATWRSMPWMTSSAPKRFLTPMSWTSAIVRFLRSVRPRPAPGPPSGSR